MNALQFLADDRAELMVGGGRPRGPKGGPVGGTSTINQYSVDQSNQALSFIFGDSKKRSGSTSNITQTNAINF
jgi:hypothetical protein